MPKPIRFLWLGAFALFAITGLCLLAALLFDNGRSDERACEFGGAVATLIAGFVCLRRASWTRFPGIWRYLLRPLIDLGCITSISISLSLLLFGEPAPGDVPPTVFFFICPIIVLLTLHLLLPRLFNPKHPDLPGVPMSAYAPASPAGSFVAAGAASPAAPSEESDFSIAGFLASLGRFTLTVIGSVLLLAAVLAALAVAADVPGFFDAPWVDPQIHREMRRTFGTADWARLFRDFGAVLSFVLATASLVLMLIARRRAGGLHMLRVVLGVVLLLAAVAALGHALPNWSELPGSTNGWELADQLAARINRPRAVGAGGIAVAGLFLLLVPARRGRAKAARELTAARGEDEKA